MSIQFFSYFYVKIRLLLAVEHNSFKNVVKGFSVQQFSYSSFLLSLKSFSIAKFSIKQRQIDYENIHQDMHLKQQLSYRIKISDVSRPCSYLSAWLSSVQLCANKSIHRTTRMSLQLNLSTFYSRNIIVVCVVKCITKIIKKMFPVFL